MRRLPYIEKGDEGNMEFGLRSQNKSFLFIILFIGGIGVFLLLLFLRLFQLTIVKGAYYRKLAEENRTREIVIEAKRGTLLDRKGIVLVQNLSAVSSDTENREKSIRSYTDGEAFAHLVGYRQLADKVDFDRDPCLTKLKSGDKTGKKGAEQLFECQLRGKPGKKLVEIDARGRYLNTLSVVPPTEGQALKLAVDSVLQKKAYELIKGKRAAVVALKPNTGEVLILAASPSFNPQSFEDGASADITRSFTDETKPMFNRASEGGYPPGSTFKLVVATGAMETKKIDESTIIEDTGSIKAGPISFGNWYYLQYGKTEGPVDLVMAIRRSNDIYFYEVGEKLGPEAIKEWAEKFGYERQTGIGISEIAGSIPSPYWKEDVLKEKWYLGDTYNLSIGQGYVVSTPLQVAQATAVFAQNGNLCRPLMLRAGSTADPDIVQYATPDCHSLHISQKTLDVIREGMKEACSTGGTGWPLFDFTVGSKEKGDERKIQTACKTGTAESQSASGVPHAWFAAFAPFENPEIVLTVLVEEAGQGSDIGGPIAKEIFKTYFERNE
ncbi:hypothetical protein HGA88_04825 [Candidatus Roizmanbacteria bacterium]|nr:hypothetical protein [Candidatus Roizmanbacteria bacterium]